MVLGSAVLPQAMLLCLVVEPITEMAVNLPVLVLARVLPPRVPGASRRLIETVAAWYAIHCRRRRIQTTSPRGPRAPRLPWLLPTALPLPLVLLLSRARTLGPFPPAGF